MNQKGFATILGLCLILAIALVVKGIQESEGNHAYETTDFQTELDLQNAAEIGIYKAAKTVKENPNILPFNRELNPRGNYQYKFTQIKIKTLSGSDINVDAWGERMLIVPYKVDYVPDPDVANKIDDGKTIDERKSYGFFSRAELTNSRTGGKLYRRAFGYVLQNDSTWTVHFLNVTAGGYIYND